MSHSWLFTGPPGSGRSNAAVAFAAALQCVEHGLRRVPRVPHGAGRVARRRGGDPHPEALDRGRRGPRPGPAQRRWPRSGRRWQVLVVEDADRLTEQACQRAAQGDRGADAAHGLDAVRPHPRGRPAHDPLPLPAGQPRHPVHRGRRRASWCAPTVWARRWRRTPPAPARATSAGPGRWPATRPPATAAARSWPIPARLTSLGACMQAATNLAEVSKEEADAITTDLDLHEKADLDSAYGVVERGRRPRDYNPALSALEKRAEDPRQASPARRRRPRPDGPRLGLPRRHRAGHRGAGRRWSTRRSAATSPWWRGPRPPSSTCAGSAGSSRPASRCWSSTCPVALALESMMVALKVPEGSSPMNRVVVLVVVAVMVLGRRRRPGSRP